MERWKPVPRYEGLYAVSSLGRVKRTCSHTNGHDGDIKVAYPDHEGFLCVSLHKAGDYCRPFAVHRLLWRAFHGPIPAKRVISHINGKKYDNRLENLELVPRGMALRTCSRPQQYVKLQEIDVLDIREDRANGCTIQQLAIDYEVSDTMIRRIVRGLSFPNLGGPRTSRVLAQR